MPNDLDRPCGDIPTPCWILSPTGHEPDLFFDGDRFMEHLDKRYVGFDVATYSFTKSTFAGAPLRKIRRLIVGLRPVSRLDAVKADHIKFVPNNHVKLFLCYRNEGDKVQDVYLGSQNLTHGTNLNLMYRVREEHVAPLVAYFNSLWHAK